jgi:hypothetical protein
MPMSDLSHDAPVQVADESLDATGLLAIATSLIGLGTVGLVSLLQIIGLLY